MSSYIVKYIANRVLKDNQWNRLGVEDPYYEYIPLDAEGKRTKKVKRRVPDGLSKNDISVLEAIKQKAYRYDIWFNVAGVQFGWSSIVGFVPVVGQLLATYWSLTILVTARGLDDGLPFDLHLLFLMNIVIDFVLGLIPIVGNLVEIGYKANLRNFLLLEKHLLRVGQKNMGIIEPNEVRSNFLNDKVGPVVEETILPGTIKAGEHLKHFVSDQYHSIQKLKVRPGTAASGSPTTVTSPETVHHLEVEDDAKSIKSVNSLNSNLKKYPVASEKLD